MILYKETFRKFGYTPVLKNGNEKRGYLHGKHFLKKHGFLPKNCEFYNPESGYLLPVILKCPVCDKKRVIKIRKIFHVCSSCSGRKNLTKTLKAEKEKIRDALKIAKGDMEISPQEWYEYFIGYHPKRKGIFIQIIGKRKKGRGSDQDKRKMINLGYVNSKRLLLTLDKSACKSKNKDDFTKHLLVFLKRQSVQYRFELLNLVYSKHCSKRNEWDICIDFKKWAKVLLTCAPDMVFARSGVGRIVTEKGSFFVDGKWIHVDR